MGKVLDESIDLIYKTREVYFNLRTLNPNHELLKYFTLNGETFGFNPDMRVKIEFGDRFGHVGLKGFESFSDFRAALIKKQFGNYKSALEEALRKFIEG